MRAPILFLLATLLPASSNSQELSTTPKPRLNSQVMQASLSRSVAKREVLQWSETRTNRQALSEFINESTFFPAYEQLVNLGLSAEKWKRADCRPLIQDGVEVSGVSSVRINRRNLQGQPADWLMQLDEMFCSACNMMKDGDISPEALLPALKTVIKSAIEIEFNAGH